MRAVVCGSGFHHLKSSGRAATARRRHHNASRFDLLGWFASVTGSIDLYRSDSRRMRRRIREA